MSPNGHEHDEEVSPGLGTTDIHFSAATEDMENINAIPEFNNIDHLDDPLAPSETSYEKR